MNLQRDRTSDPVLEILETVARLEGVDPVDLSTPLYEVIDGEALTRLLASNDGAGDGPALEVSFEYHDYLVTVDATGDLSVTPK